jgi:DNA repair exonuclease SbcCD ATPase subunit
MWSLELDLDAQMSSLETEWRHGYEASIAARTEYQRLTADPKAKCDAIDAARERLDRAEALKAGVMAKIERLEDQILSRD